MTPEEKKAYYAERMRAYRERHADDPDYRARKKAADKKYREKYAVEISERRKLDYAQNPDSAKRRAREYRQEHPEKVKAYRDANRDKRNSQTKAWHEAHEEHEKAYAKARYEEKREEILAYGKNYRQANAESLRQKAAEWRRKYPEKLKVQGINYRKNNVIKLLDKNAKRRAVLKGVTVEKIDRGEVYIRDNGICGICKCHVPLHEVTIDHIIPLSKGGEHSKRNIQIAHRSCNSAKGSKLQQATA